jgi:hypothetical protein
MRELRREIDGWLEADDAELSGDGVQAELEDVLQRGFVAVHVGELWLMHLRDELDGTGKDAARVSALARELRSAQLSVDAVRSHVERLYARMRRLGVGSTLRSARPA